MISAALENPGWVRTPGEAGNLLFIGQSRVANPNPDEAMLLGDGVDTQPGLFVNAFLAGHPDALTGVVEAQTMVLAN